MHPPPAFPILPRYFSWTPPLLPLNCFPGILEFHFAKPRGPLCFFSRFYVKIINSWSEIVPYRKNSSVRCSTCDCALGKGRESRVVWFCWTRSVL